MMREIPVPKVPKSPSVETNKLLSEILLELKKITAHMEKKA